MKVAIVYGTRPELLKLVPLIMQMKGDPSIELIIINTGQHKEMVDEIEKLFSIVPDFRLNAMTINQSLGELHQRIFAAIEPLLQKLRPEIVLVQGDTSTVATVGMACFYNKISVGHVEAGLRSYNLNEPYPEEFNRRLLSIFADYNFAPTYAAAQNLIREGIDQAKVFVTGNTIVDLIHSIGNRIPPLGIESRLMILVTAHRRENHGVGIDEICKAIKQLSKDFPEVSFVWPIHPNPSVKGKVTAELAMMKNVHLLPPVDYLQMSSLLKHCAIVWTDSGGIQEEAPSYKKPVLILRNLTERPEVVQAGFGQIVGANAESIVELTKKLLSDSNFYSSMVSGANPFGNGDASERIHQILLSKSA